MNTKLIWVCLMLFACKARNTSNSDVASASDSSPINFKETALDLTDEDVSEFERQSHSPDHAIDDEPYYDGGATAAAVIGKIVLIGKLVDNLKLWVEGQSTIKLDEHYASTVPENVPFQQLFGFSDEVAGKKFEYEFLDGSKPTLKALVSITFRYGGQLYDSKRRTKSGRYLDQIAVRVKKVEILTWPKPSYSIEISSLKAINISKDPEDPIAAVTIVLKQTYKPYLGTAIVRYHAYQIRGDSKEVKTIDPD